jgi:hypothetical protein
MLRTSGTKRSVDALAYPDGLERAEATRVAERRRAAGVDAAPSPSGMLPDDTIGFGLSGGGVRSATFCLGVFQALARGNCLGRIDVLSTVSGGGYFGAFLGRLFTRDWVKDVGDVERVLVGEDPEEAATSGRSGWGARVFRWLRENGRYLAPRGSGDVLLLGGILLRNWIAVQAVLVTMALTAFLGLQVLRALVDWLGPRSVGAGTSVVWWSPWLALSLAPLLLLAVPCSWAYWLVSRERPRIAQVSPRVGAWCVLALSVAGTLYYGRHLLGGTPPHPVRLWTCAGVALVTVLTLVFYMVATSATDPSVRSTPLTDSEADNFARMLLSKRLSTALQIAGLLLALGLVDTIGQTLYAVLREGALLSWSAAAVGAFAAVGSVARLIWLSLASATGGERPTIPKSVASWVGAVLVLGVWLIAVNVASHAVRWEFHEPCGVPPGLDSAALPCRASGPQRLSAAAFLLAATGVLAGFSFLIGQTRIFANLSSMQGFYAARLIRAYLGAGNPRRLDATTQVSDTVKGDDVAGDTYWTWPSRGGAGAKATARQPWEKGGPLHIVSATVNETVDARSGLQNQDRKGTILAIGPCGLSLGIRHHLVSGAGGWTVFPADPAAYHVWDVNSPRPPEALSLGRWASISGAAFSAAAGANTTVPTAILSVMFNIRLGYWWDSGVVTAKETWMDRLLPVQSALLAELLARTRGTAARLWNLSDGGHFENMGGYELIRRRLPIIVILDAEADPDYTFQGLSDLVRKARLDFAAEVVFLTPGELDGLTAAVDTSGTPASFPAGVRSQFGEIDALRRDSASPESRAHAALARVTYGDADDPVAQRSWLVYVKATSTGDEPEDVRCYHRAHPDFPQEAAFDQFFDEAQWESYRWLGQHIGQHVLTPELFDYLRSNQP